MKLKSLLGLLLLGSALWAPLRPVFSDNRYVITQSTPSDCGPAALATLLRFYCDVPTSEAEMARLTGVTESGTTLLKLQQAVEAKGGQADSFRMTLATLQEQLKAYPMPVIVRTLQPEPHFSILLGWDGDRVLLADPAHGNLLMPKSVFLRQWLFPGAKEGFVFIATGPDGRINQERHAEIVARMKRQHRNLQAMQAPLMRIGR